MPPPAARRCSMPHPLLQGRRPSRGRPPPRAEEVNPAAFVVLPQSCFTNSGGGSGKVAAKWAKGLGGLISQFPRQPALLAWPSCPLSPSRTFCPSRPQLFWMITLTTFTKANHKAGAAQYHHSGCMRRYSPSFFVCSVQVRSRRPAHLGPRRGG